MINLERLRIILIKFYKLKNLKFKNIDGTAHKHF